MNEWETIYQKKGIVQKGEIDAVKMLARELAKRKAEKLNVLDLGCGTGRHTFYLDRELKNKNLTITAADGSPKAISIINELAANATPSGKLEPKVLQITDKLAFANESFDAVISTFVMEHGLMKQIRARCGEVRRIIKPGGYLVFGVPSAKCIELSPEHYRKGTELEERTLINLPQDDGTLPHHFFTAKEIEELFSGYKILQKNEVEGTGVTQKARVAHLEYLFQKPLK